jgi:catechol-2,3-dioxygenase
VRLAQVLDQLRFAFLDLRHLVVPFVVGVVTPYPYPAEENRRTIATVRVLELTLPTQAIDEQRAFYAGKLGLPIVADSEAEVAVQVGATRLVLRRPTDSPGPFHFAVNVPENQLAEAKRWAAERAGLISRDGKDEFDFSDWNAHAVYFLDPDDNVVELIARHDLPNASAEPFGPGSLLEVSEVGLPVPDVGEAVAFLEDELGQAIFSGDREHFAAVGDQRGLFIVVPAGRPWFPTDRATALSPLTVALAGDRDARFELPGLPYRILVRPSGGPSAG